MSTVNIGPARGDEAPPLAAILGNWIEETDWMPKTDSRKGREGFLQRLIDGAEVTVARRGGVAVGFMAMDGEEVDALYLVPDARGNGLGSRFVELAKTGRTRVGLWTYQANAGARRFYRALGFTETRQTQGDNMHGLPDVYLEWREAE